MSLVLKKRDGLYYVPADVYTINCTPVHPIAPRDCRVVHPSPPSVPVSKSNQTELELLMLCLGSPGEDQLDLLPGNATGIPLVFEYYPFCFLDFKEQARICKQATQRLAERTTEVKKMVLHGFWLHALFPVRLYPPQQEI